MMETIRMDSCPRDDLVGHLVRYATSFGAPVREAIEVTSLLAL